MAKYSCLGLILPDALRDGGEKGGGVAGVTWRQHDRVHGGGERARVGPRNEADDGGGRRRGRVRVVL